MTEIIPCSTVRLEIWLLANFKGLINKIKFRNYSILTKHRINPKRFLVKKYWRHHKYLFKLKQRLWLAAAWRKASDFEKTLY